MCGSSGLCGELQRGVEKQLERTKLGCLNMQLSEYRYVDKIFENLRQKLRLSSETPDAKTNVLIRALFVENDEIISSSWASVPGVLGCIQE